MASLDLLRCDCPSVRNLIDDRRASLSSRSVQAAAKSMRPGIATSRASTDGLRSVSSILVGTGRLNVHYNVYVLCMHTYYCIYIHNWRMFTCRILNIIYTVCMLFLYWHTYTHNYISLYVFKAHTKWHSKKAHVMLTAQR